MIPDVHSLKTIVHPVFPPVFTGHCEKHISAKEPWIWAISAHKARDWLVFPKQM